MAATPNPGASLQGCTDRVERLIAHLATAGSEAEASQLSCQVRAELQQLGERTDALEDAAGALDDDRAALATVARHRAEHRRLGLALRAALLAAHAAIRSGDDERRAALLAGGSAAQADRSAVQSAVEVTETLRRTRQLMAEEVARSEAALSNLHESGGALRQVLDEHGRIAESVASGARTMSRIKRREATDKALNMGGLCFFLLVVAHIFGRRLAPLVRPLFGASTPPALTWPPLAEPRSPPPSPLAEPAGAGAASRAEAGAARHDDTGSAGLPEERTDSCAADAGGTCSPDRDRVRASEMEPHDEV